MLQTYASVGAISQPKSVESRQCLKKNLLTRDAFYKAARVHPASRYRGDAVARVWLRCKVRTSDHAWLRRSRQPTRIGLVFLLPGPLAPRLHQWDAFRNALGEQARATWKAGTSP
jgi:hypothetical protein